MRFLPSNRQRPHAFLHRVSAYCTLRGYTAQSDNFPAAGVAGVEKTKGRDMKYLDYFERIQKRIVSFIAHHSKTGEADIEAMMMNTKMLTKDLGTILVGKEAVKIGLINETGGIKEAFSKLKSMM